jgi:hypothetical protein
VRKIGINFCCANISIIDLGLKSQKGLETLENELHLFQEEDIVQ